MNDFGKSNRIGEPSDSVREAVREAFQDIQQRELDRRRTHIKKLDAALQAKMIALGLLDQPLKHERDVLHASARAQKVSKHAKCNEYTNHSTMSTYVPPLGHPDGQFDTWTVVREWVWEEPGRNIRLAQEHHKGMESRIVFSEEEMLEPNA